MHAARSTTRPRRRGFTLVELMIAVAVVAILAALAMPSVLSSIRKGRRADAFAALSALQQSQERWRSNHASYTATLSDLGLSSSAGKYTVSLSDASATGYTARAVGNSGTSQAADSCRTLSLRLTSGVFTYASCAGDCLPADLSYSSSNACWSQ